jgi:hypothetical protein
MMKWISAMMLLFLIMGCKPASLAGIYHLKQDGSGFGAGAENTQLEIREDGTYDIALGPLKLASGNYTLDGNVLTLAVGTTNFGTTYRVEDGKLVPLAAGYDVTYWRFVKDSQRN